MAKLEIKTETFPERCEICHQTDCFNPATGLCSRCSTVPATLLNQKLSKAQKRGWIWTMGSLVGLLMGIYLGAFLSVYIVSSLSMFFGWRSDLFIFKFFLWLLITLSFSFIGALIGQKLTKWFPGLRRR
jgi:hypothetical protein